MIRRTPRQTPRNKPHWVLKCFPVILGDTGHLEWTAMPSRSKWLRNFVPFFSLDKEEFDRELRKDLPALLEWLAKKYPETASWPVSFMGGENITPCGREVIK